MYISKILAKGPAVALQSRSLGAMAVVSGYAGTTQRQGAARMMPNSALASASSRTCAECQADSMV